MSAHYSFLHSAVATTACPYCKRPAGLRCVVVYTRTTGSFFGPNYLKGTETHTARVLMWRAAGQPEPEAFHHA